MLIKVFSREDFEFLIGIGCKYINTKEYCDKTGNNVVCFNMYVPVEKIDEVKKSEVNVFSCSTLTF